jgi:putative peptidoglycan lipid II flippase
MAVNVVASLILVRSLGFLGLALGTSIAALVHGGAALFLLRRQLPGIDGRHLLSKLVRITLAAIVMAVAAAATEAWTVSALPGASFAVQSTRLALTIGAALAVLALSAKLLRIPEFDEATAALRTSVRQMFGR